VDIDGHMLLLIVLLQDGLACCLRQGFAHHPFPSSLLVKYSTIDRSLSLVLIRISALKHFDSLSADGLACCLRQGFGFALSGFSRGLGFIGWIGMVFLDAYTKE
jgi:hypothetical protein